MCGTAGHFNCVISLGWTASLTHVISSMPIFYRWKKEIALSTLYQALFSAQHKLSQLIVTSPGWYLYFKDEKTGPEMFKSHSDGTNFQAHWLKLSSLSPPKGMLINPIQVTSFFQTTGFHFKDLKIKQSTPNYRKDYFSRFVFNFLFLLYLPFDHFSVP